MYEKLDHLLLTSKSWTPSYHNIINNKQTFTNCLRPNYILKDLWILSYTYLHTFLLHYPTRVLLRRLGLLKHGVTIFTITSPNELNIEKIPSPAVTWVSNNMQSRHAPLEKRTNQDGIFICIQPHLKTSSPQNYSVDRHTQDRSMIHSCFCELVQIIHTRN